MIKIPSVDDFIDYFGYSESIELTNLENPENDLVNEERLENAIATAYKFIISYDSLCQYPGKVAIRTAIKRLTLDISRYFLDSLHRREDVTTNYENCIKFLELCIENKNGIISLTDEELEELELTQYKKSRITYKSGRRAFTDKNLSNYRNQELYFN